jgi:hypothetical protein
VDEAVEVADHKVRQVIDTVRAGAQVLTEEE